jgi:acetyl-CoA synthetase
MRAHGITSVDELRRRSVADPAWFWDAVVADLGIPFHTPYERVLDTSRGIPWTTWFTGGRVNISAACIDRWLEDPVRADAPALAAETEDGQVRVLSYRALAAEVDRLALALRWLGIGRGDTVGVYLPMLVEAVAAAYAIARVGAVYVPIFSGFAAPAVAARLRDAGARLVLTADGGLRRGRVVPLKAVVDEAVASCPTVEHVVVLDRLGVNGTPMTPGRDIPWEELVSAHAGRAEPEDTDAEDPWLLAYTSGTTGRPKGAVHVHGGFLVKIAQEVKHQVDLRDGDRLCWVTDLGWIMGPWELVGGLALGGQSCCSRGCPTIPAPTASGPWWRSSGSRSWACRRP